MGDFNMCLFKVNDELRRGGTRVSTLAWLPWKSSEGHAMSDSCGIFYINRHPYKSVQVVLQCGLEHLRDKDDGGIGSCFVWLPKGTEKVADRYDVIQMGEQSDAVWA